MMMGRCFACHSPIAWANAKATANTARSLPIRVLAPSLMMMLLLHLRAISDASISEGDSGTQLETFTVTRSGGTAAFDVSFATSNGSATTADGDYVATSGILHFDTNQNTQTIPVTIKGDTKVELNETFNINLSNA